MCVEPRAGSEDLHAPRKNRTDHAPAFPKISWRTRRFRRGDAIFSWGKPGAGGSHSCVGNPRPASPAPRRPGREGSACDHPAKRKVTPLHLRGLTWPRSRMSGLGQETVSSSSCTAAERCEMVCRRGQWPSTGAGPVGMRPFSNGAGSTRPTRRQRQGGQAHRPGRARFRAEAPPCVHSCRRTVVRAWSGA